ncbi:MAG TPA: dihydropteroate synthase [Microscillaceae bacterium]|nr:dihydropteroate synthase [Microscillaceae bacterium]
METKGTIFYSKKTLNLQGELLSLEHPVIMGILNVTPDSFYDGGQHNLPAQILERATQLLAEGAKILDIGGYSSRPGADNISEEEEIARVVPAIQAINQAHPQAILSIDTFRARVAQAAIEAGAHIINDISGGNLDAQMYETVARLKVPYILMHMRGTPQTMTQLSQYEHLVYEILQDLQQKVVQLQALGVHDIIIDPGFGFAKNIAQNFHLMEHLGVLQALGLPVLAGISRKSMIYKTLKTTPDEALNGTIALNTIALQNGANILRVHDVKAAFDAMKMVEMLSEHKTMN